MEAVWVDRPDGPGRVHQCHSSGYPLVPQHTQSEISAAHQSVLPGRCGGSECHAGSNLISLHAGSCTGCHSSTRAGISEAIDGGQTACASCHDLNSPHPGDATVHATSVTQAAVLMFDSGAGHTRYETQYDGYAMGVCRYCHGSGLIRAHANDCSVCHAGTEPAASIGVWNKTCSQGACHATYHTTSGSAHNQAYDWGWCEDCHNNSWDTPPEMCGNCHTLVDEAAPVTSSNARATYVGTARIALTVTDAYPSSGSWTTYYRIDGAPAVAGTLITIAGPAAGTSSHAIEFWSVDTAGNMETPHKTASLQIAADTTPPVTTSDAAPQSWGPTTVRLSATDNGTSGVQATYYRLDGGAVTAGTVVNIPQPASGSSAHTLEYWSTDWSGNVESPPKSTSFTVNADVTGPTSTSNAKQFYAANWVTINITADDGVNGSGVASTYYRLDGGATTAGATFNRWYAGILGTHTLEFWSVDRAGNVESSRKAATLVIDGAKPLTTSNAVVAYVDNAVITLTAADAAGSGVDKTYYQLDEGATVEGTELSGMLAGNHTLRFWSVDRAGNVEYQKTVSFSVTASAPDTTPPTITSDAQPSYEGGGIVNFRPSTIPPRPELPRRTTGSTAGPRGSVYPRESSARARTPSSSGLSTWLTMLRRPIRS